MDVDFAANLDRFWSSYPAAERFSLAAAAGYDRVEYLFPRRHGVDLVEKALIQSGVRLSLFDSCPAGWVRGRRGMLCLPDCRRRFLEEARRDLDLAQRWRVPFLNTLAGVTYGVTPERLSIATAVENLQTLAEDAVDAGVTLLVEFISQHAIPGYALRTLDSAAEVVKAVSHPSVRLQFDQFHVTMAGLDAAVELQRLLPIVGYLQIAEAPDRTEPPEPSSLSSIASVADSSGWSGMVGLEFDPAGESVRYQDWRRRWQSWLR